MKFRIYILLLLICIFTQCVRHAPLIPKDRLFDGKIREIYKNITYDVYGRPVFEERTGKHPDKKNDQYCIVDLDEDTGLPLRTFIIYNGECSDCKPDTKKPFKVIYTWTGKGFEIGCNVAEDILKSRINDPREIVIMFGLAGVSVATGTAGGFTIGFLKSTDVFIDEGKNISLKYQEFFLGYIRYFYDESKRLVKMIHYTPAEQPIEILITDYHYNEKENVPFKTTIYSVPEKRTREILHKRKINRK